VVNIAVSLYLLSLIVWIGSIVFFSFVTAPSIFGTLPPEYASKAISAIFPKYYFLGYISGIVSFGALIFSAAKTGSWPILKILLIILMFGLTVYSGLVIHPKARALKEEIQTDTGETNVAHMKQEFDRVHRASVFNNGIVLLLGIILVILTAKNLTL
jgi:hypothetical protein